MAAFYQIEARKPPLYTYGVVEWQAVIKGASPESIALSLTEKPTPFTTNQFATIVATLVAKGYEVRLAR